MAEVSKQRLRQTLSDPKKKEFFRNFLEKERNHENLLFWLDVERYKKLHRYVGVKLTSYRTIRGTLPIEPTSSINPQQEIQEHDGIPTDTLDNNGEYANKTRRLEEVITREALTLYERYLGPNAVMRVNISFQMGESIKKRIEQGPPFPSNMFDACQEDIFKTMLADPFPRFLENCAYYALYMNRLETNPIHELYDSSSESHDSEEVDLAIDPVSIAVDVPNQVFEEFVRDGDESNTDRGWKFVDEWKGIKRFKKQYEIDGDYCVRTSSIMQVSPHRALEYVKDLNKRKSWDTQFRSGELVETISEKTEVFYLIWGSEEFTIQSLFTPRDYVVLRMEQETEQHISIVMCSIVHEKYPPIEKYVRGHLAAAGFYIQKCPENPNQCLVSYLYQGNVKGNIPKFLQKQTILKRSRMLLFRLRNVLEGKEEAYTLTSSASDIDDIIQNEKDNNNNNNNLNNTNNNNNSSKDGEGKKKENDNNSTSASPS